MRNTLKQNEEHSQIKKKIICSTFKQKKKKSQKNFELKSKFFFFFCNRASPQKCPTSILNVKQTQSKQKKQPNRW